MVLLYFVCFFPLWTHSDHVFFVSLFQYCRIIIHSFGHKAESTDTAPQTKPSAYIDTVRTLGGYVMFHSDCFFQCMEAAFALLDLWMDYMHSTGHVRYAPDFFFVGTGFAGAFLLEVNSSFPFICYNNIFLTWFWLSSSALILLRHWMRSNECGSSTCVKKL